jgi:hypothetical protein
MVSKIGPYPMFGWSASRGRDLAACARLLYWKSWGAHLGWEVDPSHEAWLAYRCKHITTINMRVGVLIHTCAREIVEAVIRGEDPPDWRVLYDRCWADLQQLRTGRLEEFLHAPKRNPVLHEHVYGGAEYLPAAYETARERLYNCVINILESSALEEISRCTSDQVIIADSIDAVTIPLGAGDEVTVWAAPDVAYRGPDDPEVVTVVDWKTGGTDGAIEQLATYALYLHHRNQIPVEPGKLRGRVVALDPYHETTFEIESTHVEAARARIRADVEVMRGFQADPSTNEAIAPAEFPMPPPEDRRQCRRCSFYLLCEPLQRSGEQDQDTASPDPNRPLDLWDADPLGFPALFVDAPPGDRAGLPDQSPGGPLPPCLQG